MPTSRATSRTMICWACDQVAWGECDRIYRSFITYVLGQIGGVWDELSQSGGQGSILSAGQISIFNHV